MAQDPDRIHSLRSTPVPADESKGGMRPGPEVPSVRVPLSALVRSVLQRVEQDSGGSGRVRLDALMEGTDGRGVYLVCILVSLPFITPIPLPGLSSVLGLAVVVVGAQLTFGCIPALPGRLGSREFSIADHRRLVDAALRTMQWVERSVRPRHGDWMSSRAGSRCNGFMLLVLGVVLTLPFPPFVPFTNSLPSWGIILLSASMMEEDGLLVWVSYLLAVLSVLYAILIYAGAVHYILEPLKRFLLGS